MTDATPFQSGQKLANGRFALLRALGRGGMGEVWLAQDERLREPVALKLLPVEIRGDPAALEDLRRETVRSQKLTHANIVRIHDLHEESDGTAFIIMEYVDGPTLLALRMQQPSLVLTWATLRPLVKQLCAALDYAHGERVIHRDLKPANVMVDSRGRLKLADFGIAATGHDSMSRVSVKNTTSGTLPYMSPQQVTGDRPIASDDIYALGATLYELLTSKLPFYSGDVTHQILHKPPEPMEERLAALEIQNEIPPEVAAMVMACLAKEPGQRPPSALSVADWIGLEIDLTAPKTSLVKTALPEAQSESAEPPPEPVPAPQPSESKVYHRQSIIALMVFLVVAALAVTTVIWKSKKGLSPKTQAAEQPSATGVENSPSHPAPGTPLNPSLEPPGNKNASDEESVSWISPQVPQPGPDGWITLFDGTRLYGCTPPLDDIKSGKVEIEHGHLRLESCLVRFNIRDTNLAIRARLRKASGQNCIIYVHGDGGWCNGDGYFGIGRIVQGAWRGLTSSKVRERFDSFFEMEMWAEGPNLTLKASDRTICSTTDTYPLAKNSIPAIGATKGVALFESVQVRMLEEAPAAAAESRLTADSRKPAPPPVPTLLPRSDRPWTNSLGMRFVPVFGTAVLFSVWDTRVQDFASFVHETGYDATQGMVSLQPDGWKSQGDSWRSPGFAQGPTHPVCGVSWDDAHAFCRWLSEKERSQGSLSKNQTYRLPFATEWSVAVGTGEYPWGGQWPPPPEAGNYSPRLEVDKYENTSPVGSFAANRYGLFDMGGNVWQWCEDRFDNRQYACFLRGASWSVGSMQYMSTAGQWNHSPSYRHACDGFRCVLVAGADGR